ncbi:ABC transporter ATP-binding protein [Roseospira goensis]|uniref:Lipopolysaccharide transport system ATP-binding protein n=1 Tax=Roseospira goensis TaxID=391922 RepID=A0A7W6S311_9PROT|nr:ABC transporter ATP-binding protein [Roseospira goensis]MBB4287816.1 lipopolysaccharide transport system ATP-binding protein [Roseospira goensis]
MCSEAAAVAPAVRLRGACKTYRTYDRPVERLFSLFPGLRRLARPRLFHSLQPLDLDIRHGEVVGIVGRNGAGKSTLLQLVCRTLPPTAGTVQIDGTVSALLELGAGFNPEFTGRENVYLSASILGIPRAETARRMDEIVRFADIGDFVDQPVKTYSSGMYVRLAFAVATAVDPDILVVDEALSVGDGAFARKSFERIMTMKAAGKTILFCSHSLYQLEAICSRVLWIDQGRLMEDGPPGDVIAHYQRFLDTGLRPGEYGTAAETAAAAATAGTAAGDGDPPAGPQGYARLAGVRVAVDGTEGTELVARSGASDVSIEVAFDSDPALPSPTVAITISTADGHILTSVATWEEGIAVARDPAGRGRARVVYPRLPLLKGRYLVGAYVFCERGIHSYGWVDPAATLEVTQEDIVKGFFRMPHHWMVEAS